MTLSHEIQSSADELTAQAMASVSLLPGDMRALAQRMKHWAREIEAAQQPARPTERLLRVVEDGDG